MLRQTGFFGLLVLLIFTVEEAFPQYKINRVVIDAGHGGKDPGALGSRSREKDITLALSLRTGEYITKYIPGVEVIYTRKTDECIELHRRAAIANTSKADLFSCELGPASPAAAYEKELRELFGAGPPPAFDLIVLGLGEDGHTASLFPRSAALNVTAHLAVPVMLPPPVYQRVTLTLPVLNNAQHVLFLVSGSTKAPALREVFFGTEGRHLPASLIHPKNGYVRWFVSRDAASLFART